ncbi:hypothetical protein HPU229336_03825 [Helicobacter pullorum]|uniref:CDP-Glycerol:Poly(Glycerophosphate) glycerophosphotransferase n=1 Tax=Helicobacter pullorum TaxID=35818 RepID=A0AAW3J231_9HELI|nr:CDP-glycerol glycerophosphotransferase family protein [Helicobacter pullorum]KPH50235.1 hypothetical protein HPU229336_03825 [Helicobacter pullorum]VEJ06681.1 CDP-Glycerol:Poly(glycerophosphate) glycerophosphotransferase [Helicobacter pullorum]
MSYFVYPSGINGTSVAKFMKIYYNQRECYCLDDQNNVDSLNENLSKIGSQDIVLVASTRHYEEITNKLEKNNLNYINGIKWCGAFINGEIDKIKQKNKKYIGIVISNHFIENHFVDIDIDLVKIGYEIIYFVFTEELYKKYSQKGICFFAPHSILEEIINVDLMILANGESTNSKVLSVDLTHGYQGMSIIPFMNVDNYFLHRALSRLDYKVVGCKRIQEIDQQYFNDLNVDTKLLPFGYLKLDSDYLKYKDYIEKYPVVSNEYVIIAFTFCDEVEIYQTLIGAIKRAGKKVIISPHPVFAIDILKKIKQNIQKRFYLKDDFNGKMEMFALSCCLITDCSSMGYTYPLTTEKPVIIFSKDKDKYFYAEDHRKNYFDKRIHYFCSNSEELISTINAIETNVQIYKKAINDYRKNECFNFSNSKKELLRWIKNIC